MPGRPHPTDTTEGGEKGNNLKTAVRETVPGVRIPLPPPRSLQCREIRLDYSGNCRKWAQFRNSCSQTGPEKVSCSLLSASVAAFFSGGPSEQSGFNESCVFTRPSLQPRVLGFGFLQDGDVVRKRRCASPTPWSLQFPRHRNPRPKDQGLRLPAGSREQNSPFVAPPACQIL